VDSLASDAVTALIDVLAAKPDAVERAGQVRMVEAVARAIETRSHLVVEAGTGTGKSLAYLVPAVLSGERVTIATATKSLQNQLADADLPFLAEHLGVPVTWSVVKGRRSYVCMAKLVEALGPDLDGRSGQLFADGEGDDLTAVGEWVRSGGSGDRDDLPESIQDELWGQVSVSGMECPGKAQCPQAGSCFAEAALDAATICTLSTWHRVAGSFLRTTSSSSTRHTSWRLLRLPHSASMSAGAGSMPLPAMPGV
jgi:ATP-dependent DNA helicase DinG